MFDIGTKEIIIIAVVIVILFGSRKIPELTKSIVDSIKHMRGAFKDDSNNDSVASETKKR